VDRVTILDEALDGLGRWYVAVPPILIIGFLAALFFLTGAGQERLQQASEQLQKSALREHHIDQLQIGLARAVAAQRGFLLTGDQRYLDNYENYAADVEPRLERLQSAYSGSDSDLPDMRTLHVLVGKRLADLAMLVAIQKSQGTSAAVALVKTSLGADTGDAINDLLEQVRDRESKVHGAAEEYWSRSLTLSRWITVAGTVFNMLLVGVAARLVYVDMRRRILQTSELRDQKLQLEREAEERNRELVELSTHLQNVAEREKAVLARELHDELGGLLVGARMDISWAELHLAGDNPELKQRLHRVQRCAGN
jgi:CHASE3 domain sensor protein